MTLYVLICCYNSSILRVPSILHHQRPEVKYVVSHQTSESIVFNDDVNLMLSRNDVVYSRINGLGLSRNRNNAIFSCAKVAQANDVCLVADDDVSYPDWAFDTILSSFQSNKADVLTFQISTGDKKLPYKNYCSESHDILKPVIRGNGYVSSIEIAFRLSSVKSAAVLFDEDFGLRGNKYPDGGEEAVFISDCIRNGLSVRYIPKVIVYHKYESSGKKQKSLSKAKMMLGVAKRTYGECSLEVAIARLRYLYRFIRRK